MGLHSVISQTFGENYAKDASVRIGNENRHVKERSLFGKGRYWKAKGNPDTASIVFTLPERKTFDVAMLQEDIIVGQRIGKFRLNYWKRQ